MNLNDTALIISATGPNRVVINLEGEATSPSRAAQKGIYPEVIFIREDGWSLGAPAHLEEAARQLWPDEWVGMIKNNIVTPLNKKQE